MGKSKKTDRILIVEDEPVSRLTLCKMLQKEGFGTAEAVDGQDAIGSFKKGGFSTVLLDLKMPGIGGVDVLKEIKKIDRGVPVIIITGYADVSTAVQTMKLGAYDFLTKPVDRDKLVITVQRSVEKFNMERELKRLHESRDSSLEWMLGSSPVMRRIIDQIYQVADSDLSIMIQGPTGTGKTFIANIIHNMSRRAKGPFVKVDLGAVPETLVESELFGCEKGAFTGATSSKEGFFEIARGGTIVIDELENLSPFVQSKLLSVVENRVMYPLGRKRPVPIDVRIITATNKDIKISMLGEKLREDLFFRLGEYIITLPPLAQRTEDIPFFAHKFLAEACSELNRKTRSLHEDTIDMFMRYNWPGNIREMKNILRRAVLLSDSGEVMPEHIAFLLDGNPEPSSTISLMLPLKETVNGLEKNIINRALEIYNGNKSKVAEVLKIDIKTLRTKMKEHHIG